MEISDLMTVISDLKMVMVALFTITFAAIGGIAVVLFKMNGTLGEIKNEIQHIWTAMDRVLDRLDKHDRRLKKLEKKRR